MRRVSVLKLTGRLMITWKKAGSSHTGRREKLLIQTKDSKVLTHTHTHTHTHVHTHIYLFCVIFLERNLLPNIHFAFYHFHKPVSGSRESTCLSKVEDRQNE